jgi:hypothetical protein
VGRYDIPYSYSVPAPPPPARAYCAAIDHGSDPYHFNADPEVPDPALHFNADPDPAFHFNVDPDPDPAPHQGDVNLRPSRPPL